MHKQRMLCIVIVGGILLGATGIYGWSRYQQQAAAVGIAEVSVNGEVLYTYDLQQERKKPEYLKISEDDDGNVVEIGTGYIVMYKASCPDQICVKTGKISKPGQTIVCLPHKVLITIKERSDGNADAVDAQT